MLKQLLAVGVITSFLGFSAAPSMAAPAGHARQHQTQTVKGKKGGKHHGKHHKKGHGKHHKAAK